MKDTSYQRIIIGKLDWRLYLNRFFQLFFFLWLAFLFCLTLQMYSRPIAVLGGAIVGILTALAVFCQLYKKEKTGSDRFMLLALVLSCAVFLFGCLIVGKRMLVPPFNDTGSVYYAVAEIFEEGKISQEINKYTTCAWATHTSNHDYFLIYKNCCFLVWYLLQFFRVLDVILPGGWTYEAFYTEAGLYACLALNLISMCASMIFGFFALKKKAGNPAALAFLLLFCAFLPYYLNIYKAYSDSLSMPYLMLSVLLFFSADQNSTTKRAMLLFLSGISLSIGALIKGSVYILLVAEVILVFFQKRSVMQRLTVAGALLAACFVVYLSWSICLDHATWIDRRNAEALEFPAIHWIMMASIGDGGYRQEDFDFTASFEGVEAKKTADKEEFVRRVQSYGSPFRYFWFQAKKLAAVLSDGNYAQNAHLYFALPKNGRLRELVYGSYSNFYTLYISIFSCVFYLSFLASAGMEFLTQKRGLEMFLNVSFFGILLFFSFWEIKSRYLFNFTPLFMMCTVTTWSQLPGKLCHRGGLGPRRRGDPAEVLRLHGQRHQGKTHE